MKYFHLVFSLQPDFTALLNILPIFAVFCDKCAAVDPAEPKVYSEKIIFNTGCSSDICVADLEIKSHNVE